MRSLSRSAVISSRRLLVLGTGYGYSLWEFQVFGT